MPYYTLEKVAIKPGQSLSCLYKIADQDESPLSLEVSETFVRNGTQYQWGTCTDGDRQGQNMTLDAARVLEMQLGIADIKDFEPVPLKDGRTRMVTAGHFRVFGFVEDVTELAYRSAIRRGGLKMENIRVPYVHLVKELVHEDEEPD